jgi:hypothetical protein
MLVYPNERIPIARLLQFLEHGERLAHDCARAQAELAPEPAMRRFLLAQARQEASHSVVFRAAMAWLAPRHLADSPLLPPLAQYRVLLDDAIRRQNLVETLLAEQIILEGLGEAILKRIEGGLAKRGAPFGRLRRILIHQEEAHHAFGHRYVQRAIEAGHASPDTLRSQGLEYVGLAEAMVRTLGELFDSIDENADAWISDARDYLPAWLSSDESII